MSKETPTFYEIQSLLGTKLVGVNEVSHVFAKPGERRAIATYGLATCTAVAIQFEKISNPNDKGTIIAHYAPYVVSRLNVGNDIRVNSEDITSLGVKAKALIVSPGAKDSSSPTGHSPQPEEEERVNILERALKEIFGETTDVSKVGYHPWRNRGWIRDLLEPRDRGTVLAEFSPNSSFRLAVDGIEVTLPLA